MSNPRLQVDPELYPIPSTRHSPNSPFPVITSEWVHGGHWKIGGEKVAATPHYHGTTHEAYTVLRGSGTYLLGRSTLDPETDWNGNPVGMKFVARAGDVFVFPAGVTHYVTETEDEYEIIGFYSLNDRNSRENPYDMEYALESVEETEKKRVLCRQVPVPLHDPIYGTEGIPRIWREE
ncbi:hypothetical protein BO86DRAFT_422017 [Aspergillus japonicus CBS 114.51]|uniref:Cupin type-1 domain-containing protein n=1 Tax=Aspergillus japonicus CBS 114.51 TaxID=1448312 RepID=A0A8T8WQB9_ASPJA|nr:hypothetical protein BO86DRAFT_422017 [Aspergillus japonicus CBS 114.51]RAH77850.1 hypothetical protein BO86DRAFT_422017 [Aspergillus japonicus CBS 114.51]